MQSHAASVQAATNPDRHRSDCNDLNLVDRQNAVTESDTDAIGRGRRKNLADRIRLRQDTRIPRNNDAKRTVDGNRQLLNLIGREIHTDNRVPGIRRPNSICIRLIRRRRLELSAGREQMPCEA